MKTRDLTIIVLSAMLLFNGCAAVRMMGRVASAAGGEMVRSADEEETKKKGKLANGSETAPANLLEVKKKLTSVKVRPEPSTKRPALATLTGGDKVEKLNTKKGWIKIRFSTDESEGEGWVKSDTLQ